MHVCVLLGHVERPMILSPRWPVEALASFSCASLYTIFHTQNCVTHISAFLLSLVTSVQLQCWLLKQCYAHLIPASSVVIVALEHGCWRLQCLLGSTLAVEQKCHMSRSQTAMTPQPPHITLKLGPHVTKSDNNDTRATKHHN